VAGSSEDLVRVFFLQNVGIVQNLQEVATLIRSTAEIRRLFTYNTPMAIAVRGTPAQLDLAQWLVTELDRPLAPKPTTQPARQRLVAGSTEDVVRIFTVANADSIQSLQEIATLVRAMTEIRRVFTYNAPRNVVVRGNPEQIAMAGWLFHELDRPAQTPPGSDPHEYRGPQSNDILRVFYLAHAPTPQRLQEIATQVRTMAEIRRLFTYNQPRALAIRGTPDQLELADRLIKERDKP
jgi:hypothetical protein